MNVEETLEVADKANEVQSKYLHHQIQSLLLHQRSQQIERSTCQRSFWLYEGHNYHIYIRCYTSQLKVVGVCGIPRLTKTFPVFSAPTFVVTNEKFLVHRRMILSVYVSNINVLGGRVKGLTTHYNFWICRLSMVIKPTFH